MNLRRAHLDDLWKTAFRRNYSTCILSIEYCGGKVFEGLKLSLKGGLNAIVGRNGIGKSNLMRSMFNSFATEDSNRERFETPLLKDGIAHISFKLKDNQKDEVIQLLESLTVGDDVVGFMFDPSITIPFIQNVLVQSHFEELLESHAEVIVDGKDLKLINFLTNGEYTHVSLFNIEDEYEGLPFPFFSVKTTNAEYDSRDMGMGELSLFYFYWLIKYMSKIEQDKILFVEEPESFLPPATQERFVDVLAMIAATDGVAIVMSTHSEHMLRRMPRPHVHTMKRSATGVICACANDNNEPLKVLGLSAPKKGILLYEDIAAEILLKSILSSSLTFTPDSFYYHKSGSDGDICTDLKRFPPRLEDFRIIGVFDGDCAGKHEKILPISANYCFLPDVVAPEIFIIEYFKSKDVVIMSQVLNKSVVQLIDAKTAAAGSDHHDYFYDISEQLGLHFREVLGRVCDLWVADNSALVTKFLSDFEKFYAES